MSLKLPTNPDSLLLSLRKRRKTATAEMDITPMIDITFLLLIFFIVCSTLNQVATVPLPPASFGSAVNEKDAVIITIDGVGADSVVYLGASTSGVPLPPDPEIQAEMILNKVKEQFTLGKDLVVIRAAGPLFQSEVDRIERIVSSCQGIRTLHLAVKEN
ncbi:MAG: ExbD/TolR family protein [Thermoguttaceae bacterium]